MRTIGRHWPKGARGDYPELCTLCGVKWRRSQLIEDRNGFLVCPDDVGPDKVPYARAGHVLNDEGTGASLSPNLAGLSDEVPVLL